MLIGYARTSTSNQKYSLEDQIEKLTSKGCEKIFFEEISSVSSNRPEFEKSLEFAREGDNLVVTTSVVLPDRLQTFGRMLRS